MRQRIIINKVPVNINQVILHEEGRRQLFNEAIRGIMSTDGISYQDAKAKLQRELKHLTLNRMFNLKSA